MNSVTKFDLIETETEGWDVLVRFHMYNSDPLILLHKSIFALNIHIYILNFRKKVQAEEEEADCRSCSCRQQKPSQGILRSCHHSKMCQRPWRICRFLHVHRDRSAHEGQVQRAESLARELVHNFTTE